MANLFNVQITVRVVASVNDMFMEVTRKSNAYEQIFDIMQKHIWLKKSFKSTNREIRLPFPFLWWLSKKIFLALIVSVCVYVWNCNTSRYYVLDRIMWFTTRRWIYLGIFIRAYNLFQLDTWWPKQWRRQRTLCPNKLV